MDFHERLCLIKRQFQTTQRILLIALALLALLLRNKQLQTRRRRLAQILIRLKLADRRLPTQVGRAQFLQIHGHRGVVHFIARQARGGESDAPFCRHRELLQLLKLRLIFNLRARACVDQLRNSDRQRVVFFQQCLGDNLRQLPCGLPLQTSDGAQPLWISRIKINQLAQHLQALKKRRALQRQQSMLGFALGQRVKSRPRVCV